MRPPTPETPEHPTIPMSDPEAEQQVIDEILNAIKETENPIIIDREVADDVLDKFGFCTDENGYLRDAETGDYVPPYAYDSEKYNDDEDDEYLSPVQTTYYGSDTSWPGADPDPDDSPRIPLDDVYGFAKVNGETVVVRDNWCEIDRLWEETGYDLRLKTEWEDTTEFLEMAADTLTSD